MKSSWNVCWSVAFVWFVTHFGGGFASGRQLVAFYVKFGRYALFMPVLSVAIVGLVLWCAWRFAVRHRVYDYHSWSVRYFKPLGALEPIFSVAIEVMYSLILLLITAVAFATGGTVLAQLFPSVPYIVGTIVLAVSISLLTIWGAGLVRKASTLMSLVIIGGLMVICFANFVANGARFSGLLQLQPAASGGFWAALWQSVKYAAMQCTAIGAYIAIADVLRTSKDVTRAALLGFIVNALVLSLSTVGMLLHYPHVLSEKAPITYIAAHSGLGSWGAPLISVIILLAVVSSAVGIIYGSTRRISAWWSRRTSTNASRRVEVSASVLFVLLSWGISSFGLIPLIGKGYGMMGMLAAPLVTIPILLMGGYRVFSTRLRARAIAHAGDTGAVPQVGGAD